MTARKRLSGLKFRIFSAADNWSHKSRRCPKRLQRTVCDRFDDYIMRSFDDPR